jgi:hypothetical protein
MGGTYSTKIDYVKFIQNFGWKTCMEETALKL